MAYIYAKINKETLAHICKSKGITCDFLVKRTKLNAEKISLWTNPANDALPTIKQAKTIASCIHIPFAGLYMNPGDIPLKQIPSVKNMRRMDGLFNTDDSALNIAIIDVLLERDFLINANEEFHQTIVPFSPKIPLTEDVSTWANAIRSQFKIELEKQYKCRSPRQYYLYLRNQIEKAGVFVHCFTDVPVECVRGFALFETALPIIGVNDDDRPPAKSFTIVHELVHLMKRESSLCNEMTNTRETLAEEVFCNAVAGELLVPERALVTMHRSGHYENTFSTDDIKQIANYFSVSREVIIRRLRDLRIIDQIKYDTFAERFKKEHEQERERQRNARKNGIKTGIPRDVSREAIDRTSSAVSRILYYGYGEDFYSKQDIARHLGIDQKHIKKFLTEVSKWNK